MDENRMPQETREPVGAEGTPLTPEAAPVPPEAPAEPAAAPASPEAPAKPTPAAPQGGASVKDKLAQMPPKKRRMLLGGGAVVLVLLVVLLVAGRQSKLEKIQSYIAKEYSLAPCSRASDDSCLEIDTNPLDQDIDDLDYAAYVVFAARQEDALNAIQYANEQLGFPASVYQKMMSTTALMGRQSHTGSKYTVSWSYHPDHGLEVLYEKNR